MFSPPNHSAEYCSSASPRVPSGATRIAGRLLWRFPVQKFRKFHSEDMSSPFRSYECRLFDNRCHRIHCLSEVVKQKLHVCAAFFARRPRRNSSQPWIGRAAGIYVNLGDIRDCTLRPLCWTYHVQHVGKRGTTVLWNQRKLVPIHCSFDRCLGHR